MVYGYVPNFASIGLFCRSLLAKTPNFCRFFWTSAFSVVANWQQSEKVEHGCATTNLLIPNGSKILFLYSNAFMAKSGAQSLTFKSVTNKQADRQTDKQKNSTFWLPRRRVKSEPHQTWHGDKGPRARSCTSKTFGGLTHSFAARGRSKCGWEPDPLNLTPVRGEKPQKLPFFGLRHFVVSPIGSSLRKLNTGAQLKTFPYAMASK